ncbi:MAG TPA: DUF3536 domain-containing protein [Candidatus Binataceae bacterium]|nr:DUF3536 domain-containing protein [Candidatus Binataceae bacterium]
MSEAQRSIVIHGHFYQPPRESPWTGLIAPEPSAAPFSNWNERITSECYGANAHAPVSAGSVIHLRNNYEHLSCDFGPTLMGWMQRHGKQAYGAIVRADALSAQRLGGQGNTLAQSYNHSILPLLLDADKELQIAWGIEDFRFRFKRLPVGIWLPECAADPATLAAVARAGIKFVILAPWQGRFQAATADESAGAGPFVWRSDDLSLAVFRYDRELSSQVAFGDALVDGERWADAIIARARGLAPGATLLIATDGETFGHHKRHGAAELARAFDRLAREPDLSITNCAEVLQRVAPAGNFTLEGVTSWSCAHGVERWRSDCGCRLSEGTSQSWRAPLREAMEFVKTQVDTVYAREAASVLADPRAALLESIGLALDPSPALAEQFFIRYKVGEEAARARLQALFEMQRAAQAAFTSCAWFFDDFAGLEGRIVLRWAARAVELAAFFSPSIEPELLERLRGLHSNRRESGDGATLYLSLKAREPRVRS